MRNRTKYHWDLRAEEPLSALYYTRYLVPIKQQEDLRIAPQTPDFLRAIFYLSPRDFSYRAAHAEIVEKLTNLQHRHTKHYRLLGLDLRET